MFLWRKNLESHVVEREGESKWERVEVFVSDGEDRVCTLKAD